MMMNGRAAKLISGIFLLVSILSASARITGKSPMQEDQELITPEEFTIEDESMLLEGDQHQHRQLPYTKNGGDKERPKDARLPPGVMKFPGIPLGPGSRGGYRAGFGAGYIDNRLAILKKRVRKNEKWLRRKNRKRKQGKKGKKGKGKKKYKKLKLPKVKLLEKMTLKFLSKEHPEMLKEIEDLEDQIREIRTKIKKYIREAVKMASKGKCDDKVVEKVARELDPDDESVEKEAADAAAKAVKTAMKEMKGASEEPQGNSTRALMDSDMRVSFGASILGP